MLPPALATAWDHIWLDFKLTWPLGVLLTPHALARYNALFQYLTHLKRTVLRLEEMWQSLQDMTGRGGGRWATGRKASQRRRGATGLRGLT